MLTTLIFSFLPAILGIALVYIVLSNQPIWRIHHHMIACSAGIYIGYLSTASIIFLSHFFSLPKSAIGTVMSTVTLSLAICAAGLQIKTRQQMVTPGNITKGCYCRAFSKRIIATIMLLCLSFSIAGVFFEIAHRPATSWDTVLYWTDYPASLLEQLSKSDFQQQLPPPYRHPKTIGLIAVWGSYSTTIGHELDLLLYSGWFFAYFAILLAILGYCIALEIKNLLALAIVLAISTNPLIVAHSSLGGYSEIWLCCAITLTLTLPSLRDKRNSQIINSLLFFIALSLTFIKSSAFVYTVVITTAYFLSTAPRKLLLYLVLSLCLIFAIFLISHFYYEELEFLHSIAHYDTRTMTGKIGLYDFSFQNVLFFPAFKNLLSALILSSSYQLIALLLLALPTLLLIPSCKRNPQTKFTIFVVTGLLVSAYLSQVVSPYFLQHSYYDRDTSLTRFLMPLLPASFIALVTVLKPTQRCAGNTSFMGVLD